ncbi:MAG: hypothetical protein ABFS17_08195 [Chloroflexota bacterium]
MKHMQVLKQAWQILWNYRTLWVFGIILALTSAGGSSYQSNQITADDDLGYQFNLEEPIMPQFTEVMKESFKEAFTEFDLVLAEDFDNQIARQVLRAVLWFAGVVITLALIGKIFRYTAEVSLIKMVDKYEASDEKVSAREGFKLGWSREAWRIFLVDLIIELPFIVACLLLIGLILVPVLIWSGDNTAASLVSMLTSIGLAMLLGLALLAVRAVLAVVKPVIRREIAINDATVGTGIRQGFKLARQYWKETGLMWLILFGINVVWPLLLIPVVLLSVVLAGGLGVGSALLIGGEAFTTGAPAMFWALFVGLGLFVLVLAIPIGFINGLKETFQSSTWTLTYREIKALKSLENGDTPVIEAEVPVS